MRGLPPVAGRGSARTRVAPAYLDAAKGGHKELAGQRGHAGYDGLARLRAGLNLHRALDDERVQAPRGDLRQGEGWGDS